MSSFELSARRNPPGSPAASGKTKVSVGRNPDWSPDPDIRRWLPNEHHQIDIHSPVVTDMDQEITAVISSQQPYTDNGNDVDSGHKNVSRQRQWRVSGEDTSIGRNQPRTSRHIGQLTSQLTDSIDIPDNSVTQRVVSYPDPGCIEPMDTDSWIQSGQCPAPDIDGTDSDGVWFECRGIADNITSIIADNGQPASNDGDRPSPDTETACDFISLSNTTFSDYSESQEQMSTSNQTRARRDQDGDDDGASDEPIRGVWSHSIEFFFSCLGYTVGLEAVWHFPYLMAKNGGGAFLLPYFLSMMLIGVPMLYLEMFLGQYTSQGPIHVWLIAPLFGGVGYVLLAVSFLVSCYQSVFISWALYYLFASMSPGLPWLHCSNSPNTSSCCEARFYVDNCTNVYPTLFVQSPSCYVCYAPVAERNTTTTEIHRILENKEAASFSNTSVADTSLSQGNHTLTTVRLMNTTAVSPQEQYFHFQVLGLSEDVSKIGVIQWKLFLCLMLTWVLVFACVCKNIKSAGKVAYITFLLPLLTMIGLLVKASLLEGSRIGVLRLLQPHWYKLADTMVWKDAAVHVIIQLGPCSGGITTLASYNTFTCNFYRVATLLPLFSSVISLLIGCLIYTSLGHLAWTRNAPLQDLAVQDLKLAFITYPEAMSMEHPAFIAVFYLMLVLMCLARVLPSVLAVITALLDSFNNLNTRWQHRTLLILAACGILAVCSIPLISQGGLYLIEIIRVYATMWSMYVIGILECLVVIWIYKFKVIQNNIWLMIGKHPGKWTFITWGILSPGLLMVLLAYSIIFYIPLTYNKIMMPWSADVASWILCAVIVLSIPVYGVYAILSHDGNLTQRMKKVLSPPKGWGPSGTFSDFLNHQLRHLPDYMISEKEQHQHPVVWKRELSGGASSDGEFESVSTTEGLRISPPGVQQGDNIDTGSIQWSEDENKFRGNWTGRFDFLFSALGYTVGLGNVWRFPYIVYKNGGGAFFVPYLIMFVFCGLPLFYMELALGQFASVGPITVWRLAPFFRGVGYTSVVTLFLVALYYNVFAAWSIYYIAASMTSQLPWAHCNKPWNTPECREASFYNNTVHNQSDLPVLEERTTTNSWNSTTYVTSHDDWSTSFSHVVTGNVSSVTAESSSVPGNSFTVHPSPSAEYFFNQVLGLSKGIDEMGSIRWHLALSLLFCWSLTFVGLIKGIKTAGKIVYVTVLLPYAILIAFLIRFVTLDSDAHLDGIRYFVTPQWQALSRVGVWGDAATQLFFSLGLCMGGLVALGSHNRFHYNCYRDAYLVCCVDTLTSVFAGFVIFSVLGVMAKEKGTDVANVVDSSFALAYIVIPDVVTRIEYGNAWSILFFFMMFLLAVDSHFLMMEAIVIAIMDEFSKYLYKRRLLVILILCSVMFLLGLPFVTQGGLYLLALVDAHVAAWSPLIIGLVMCLTVSWVYKIKYFSENIKAMFGEAPSWWWKLMWKFVTPALLLFILVFSWIMYKPVTVDNNKYPLWAQILGILMSLAPVVCIPVVPIIQMILDQRSCKEVARDNMLPELQWGPALEKHRVSCYMPSTVNNEESIARINEWLATGQNGVFDEVPSPNVCEEDPEAVTVGDIKPEIQKHRSSITGYTADSPLANGGTKKQSFSDSSSVSPDLKRDISVKLRRRQSGLRVTFQYEEDEPKKILRSNLVTTSTQTDKSYLYQKAKELADVEIHGQKNQAFEPEPAEKHSITDESIK